MIIQGNLSSEMHINRAFNETYRQLTNMKIAFLLVNEMMLKLIALLIHPRLEYVAVFVNER